MSTTDGNAAIDIAEAPNKGRSSTRNNDQIRLSALVSNLLQNHGGRLIQYVSEDLEPILQKRIDEAIAGIEVPPDEEMGKKVADNRAEVDKLCRDIKVLRAEIERANDPLAVFSGAAAAMAAADDKVREAFLDVASALFQPLIDKAVAEATDAAAQKVLEAETRVQQMFADSRIQPKPRHAAHEVWLDVKFVVASPVAFSYRRCLVTGALGGAGYMAAVKWAGLQPNKWFAVGIIAGVVGTGEAIAWFLRRQRNKATDEKATDEETKNTDKAKKAE